jgi:hypothetical protein
MPEPAAWGRSVDGRTGSRPLSARASLGGTLRDPIRLDAIVMDDLPTKEGLT